MKTTAIVILLLSAFAGAPPSHSATSTEDEVLDAIRGRLAASARNDTAAWTVFVDDAMVAPLESELPSKRAWLQTHKSWPREIEYSYGPIEDPKVRIHGDTAVVVYHAQQFTKI